MSGLYLVWTDKFTVNVPILDEQHRGIVCTINSFWFSVQSGDGVQALAPTLAVLEQYTKLHFKTEEAMLAKAAFPGLKEHVALHRKLVHDMGRVASDATATGNPSLLLDFLRTWWRDHILANDLDYATFVAAHAPAGGW